jgi:hypothetical protein
VLAFDNKSDPPMGTFGLGDKIFASIQIDAPK